VARSFNTGRRVQSNFALRLVLLAGPLCSGKTTLANLIRTRDGAVVVYAREVLYQHGASNERRSLQDIGAKLEAATQGAWLAEAVTAAIRHRDRPAGLVVVDSVRTLKQLKRLRNLSGDAIVIYLTASRAALSRRFRLRLPEGIDSSAYDVATKHPSERSVLRVGRYADLTLDTTGVPTDRIYDRVRQLQKSRAARTV
jgi:adenylosuccinate synthase